jgi:hypothetical protein
LVFAFFRPNFVPKEATITAHSPDGPLKLTLKVDEKQLITGNERIKYPIHTLAAKALIRDLEEGTSHLHANGKRPDQVIT